MVTRIGGIRPPRIYIDEWMATKPGLDRKRLAERMGTTPGTITKKLQEPWKIDAIWLERFREALGLASVTDLFRDPAAPTPDEMLKGLNEEERGEVTKFADYVRLRASRA